MIFMLTTLYLIRHAATAANLEVPAKLQGRGTDPVLAEIGIAQAVATRRLLESTRIDACYTSPLRRAVETATIIANGLPITSIDALTECDVGRWEGLSWETIRESEPELYERYMANPATFGYPDGESFGQVAERATPAITHLLESHVGQTIVVVSHHVVNRVYLAGVLGMPPAHARKVSLDNCGVSVVTHQHGKTTLRTLNSIFHL